MVGVLVYESNPYKTERNACSVHFITCAVCALPGTAVYMASVPGGLSDRLTRRVYAGAPGPLLAMCTHRPTSEEPRASSRNVPVETTNH